MKIQNIPWITHTHTDCYDVCKIYEGEMPYLLWGNTFWDNHFYLVNSENSFEEVTEYDQCIDLINMGYRYDNEMLSLKNFPLFNFMTYILFIMSIIYAFIKNNEK